MKQNSFPKLSLGIDRIACWLWCLWSVYGHVTVATCSALYVRSRRDRFNKSLTNTNFPNIESGLAGLSIVVYHGNYVAILCISGRKPALQHSQLERKTGVSVKGRMRALCGGYCINLLEKEDEKVPQLVVHFWFQLMFHLFEFISSGFVHGVNSAPGGQKLQSTTYWRRGEGETVTCLEWELQASELSLFVHECASFEFSTWKLTLELI